MAATQYTVLESVEEARRQLPAPSSTGAHWRTSASGARGGTPRATPCTSAHRTSASTCATASQINPTRHHAALPTNLFFSCYGTATDFCSRAAARQVRGISGRVPCIIAVECWVCKPLHIAPYSEADEEHDCVRRERAARALRVLLGKRRLAVERAHHPCRVHARVGVCPRACTSAAWSDGTNLARRVSCPKRLRKAARVKAR
jgi:hypothetical protein